MRRMGDKWGNGSGEEHSSRFGGRRERWGEGEDASRDRDRDAPDLEEERWESGTGSRSPRTSERGGFGPRGREGTRESRSSSESGPWGEGSRSFPWSGSGGSSHPGRSGAQRYGVASSQGYGGAVEREGYGGFGSEGERPARGSFGYSREGYGSEGGSRGTGSSFQSGSTSARREWDRSGSEWAGGERGGHGGSSSSIFQGGSLRKQSPKGYTRSDERIREDVCDRLTESYLECEEVTVTVKNGEVVLGGRAPSGETRRQIERVAEGVTGVQDVTNQIRTRRDESGEDDSGEQRTQRRGHETGGSASSASSSTRKEGRKTV